jgi:hypothetical protein
MQFQHQQRHCSGKDSIAPSGQALDVAALDLVVQRWQKSSVPIYAAAQAEH